MRERIVAVGLFLTGGTMLTIGVLGAVQPIAAAGALLLALAFLVPLVPTMA